jgi:hypothetical protein
MEPEVSRVDRVARRVRDVFAGPFDRRLVVIWSAAILIRLALAPFAAHVDLYSIYSRAAEAAYDGQWFGWGSQFAIQTIHNIWLFLMRPLLPGAADIWSTTAGVFGVGVQQHEFSAFLGYEYLSRALFLLKLPYIIADLVVGFLLMKMVTPERRSLVAGLWLLNPLVIYTTVLFARHDSIAIAVMLTGVVLATAGHRYLGLGALLVAALLRFFPILVAPFFLIAYRRTGRELAYLTGILVGGWMLLDGLAWGITGDSPTLTLVNRYPHVAYLFELSVPLYDFPFGATLQLLIFPLAYLFVLLWYYERTPYGTQDLVAASAAVFCLVFALTFFHPQYAIWLVPFMALAIARYRFLLPLHIIQILLLLLHTLQWGSATTTELFLPVSVEAVETLPDPRNVIAAQIPLDLFFAIVRTALAAVSIWIAPATVNPRFSAMRVAIGNIALRRACLRTISPVLRPLAFSVRT